jgi:chemotaxis protein MotB|tara:strand:+ start:4413 stop:5609 length:1197 start_codon:yes stop_codon:yes gene_type:complete
VAETDQEIAPEEELPADGEAPAEVPEDEELVDNDLDIEKPKKEKKEECPTCEVGAPAWMATFADMATLLMAFFVLILSFASVNVPKFEQIAGSLSLAFGVARIIPKVSIPMAETIIASDFTPSEAAPTVIPNVTQTVEDSTLQYVKQRTETEDGPTDVQADYQQVLEAMANEIETGQVEVKIQGQEIVIELKDAFSTNEAGAEGLAPGGRINQETLDIAKAVTDLQRQIETSVAVKRQTSGDLNAEGTSNEASSKFETIKMALSEQISQGLAEVEQDGDKVIIRLGQQDSFASGSANLQTGFTQTLTDVGNAVSATGGLVRVEGHTDNIPVAFSERFRSNWDLSSARSAAVANFLLDNSSLEAGRVTITGLADSDPIADNGTAAGRAQNRRIEVIVDG